MPTIIPDTVNKRPYTDGEMTYLKNNNVDEAICQKLRENYLYKTDMHNIYKLIVGQTNNQLQEKVAS